MPRLIFLDPKFAGRVYQLVVERTTVGRGEANTLVIVDDSVSRQHCEILLWGAEVIVRDLGSRNGTLVGDQFLQNHQAQALSGQQILFGSVIARLELDPAGTSEPDDQDDTALHELTRLLREQGDPRKQTVPVPVPMTVSAGPASDPVGQTIGLRKLDRREPLPAPTAAEPRGEERWRRIICLVLAGLVLAGLFVLGLVLARRAAWP